MKRPSLFWAEIHAAKRPRLESPAPPPPALMLHDDCWREIGTHLETLRDWRALTNACRAIRRALYCARDLAARISPTSIVIHKRPPHLSLAWLFGQETDTFFHMHLQASVRRLLGDRACDVFKREDGAWITGGAARRCILEALRQCTHGRHRPHAALTTTCGDVDLWLDMNSMTADRARKLLEMLIRPGANIYSRKPTLVEFLGETDITVQLIAWDGAHDRTPLEGFDLGCSEFAIRGGGGQQIAWSTAAFVSLATGEGMSYRLEPNQWPFDGPEFTFSPACPKVFTRDRYLWLKRLVKYAARGHTFGRLDVERAQQAIALPDNDAYEQTIGARQVLAPADVIQLRDDWLDITTVEREGYPMALSVEARWRWLCFLYAAATLSLVHDGTGAGPIGF